MIVKYFSFSMHRFSIAWLFFCVFTATNASHFRGGTITWKPIDNNVTTGGQVSVMISQTYTWTKSQIGCNSSMVALQSPPISLGTKAGSGMNLTCNASCSTSGGYVGNEVPITGYCTDFSDALDLTVMQRSDIVSLTMGAYFTVTFGAGGGWQTLALGNSSGWSLSSLIDLRVRPDNGLINTPPVATCISYISIPVNVTETIQIPVLDTDNDFLRCRFANGTSECLNTCPPGSLPPGTSLSSSCVLTITGATDADYYLVAAQVSSLFSDVCDRGFSSFDIGRRFPNEYQYYSTEFCSYSIPGSCLRSFQLYSEAIADIGSEQCSVSISTGRNKFYDDADSDQSMRSRKDYQ